jgi:large subunit ribosomal protein L15
MPLQRRLPKYGFVSRKASWTAEVRLDALARLSVDTVDLPALRAARLINRATRRVKVIASGKLDRPIAVRGLAVSKGARAAIEAAGGKVETDNG